VRLVCEDVGQGVIQVLFLADKWQEVGLWSKVFTISSVAVGLIISIAGPLTEKCVQHRMQAQLAEHIGEEAAALPELSTEQPRQEVSERVPDGASDVHSDGPELNKLLEEAEKTTTRERITGNIDYVHALMLDQRPVIVPDVGIMSIIENFPVAHMCISLVALLFWIFVLINPIILQEQMSCSNGIPAKSHLLFFMVVMLGLFTEVWCAVLTKYGYLLLAHAPQQFGLALVFSFLGRFDAYSDACFVAIARNCGSPLWKYSLLLNIVGVGICQALPGLLLLVFKKRLPYAFKFNELNVLMMLFKV